LEAAQTAQKAATEAFRAAEEAVKTARLKPFAADKAVTSARDRVESLMRDQTRREARAQALDETVARLDGEVAEAKAALEAAQRVEAPSEPTAGRRDELAAARVAADAARHAAQTARSTRDEEARDRAGREQRLGSLSRAHAGWAGRSKDSAARVAALGKDADRTSALLRQAEIAPQGFAEQRGALMDALIAAETRKGAAAEALSLAETTAADSDRASRAAEAAAGAAREARAGLAVRAEAASERLVEAEATLRETA